MTFDFAQFLLLTLVSFLVYVIVVTISGAFQAFVAYWCGDDSSETEEFMTLDPLVHIDPVGLFCFYVLGIGWGRQVPVNPQNIRSRAKFIVASFADSIMCIGMAVVALVALVALYGAGSAQGFVSFSQMRVSYPQYTSFAFISMIILKVLIDLSAALAILYGVNTLCRLIVLFYFPEKQYDPDAQFWIRFGPLFVLILFFAPLKQLVHSMIVHAGYVIASFLKLL